MQTAADIHRENEYYFAAVRAAAQIAEAQRECYICPRTLVDAFGPGAQLDIERPPRPVPGTGLIPWVIVAAVAALYVYEAFGGRLPRE